VPVVAPGFLPFPVSRALTPVQMASVTQCIVRDSASAAFPKRDYFVLPDGPRCTVADQLTKKAVILGGMGWGRLPRFLIDEELGDGRLVSIAGRHIRPNAVELRFVRRRAAVPGPVAERLWRVLGRSSAPAQPKVSGSKPAGPRSSEIQRVRK
jgi:DNA-binding transcriptional LysR family regulator